MFLKRLHKLKFNFVDLLRFDVNIFYLYVIGFKFHQLTLI